MSTRRGFLARVFGRKPAATPPAPGLRVFPVRLPRPRGRFQGRAIDLADSDSRHNSNHFAGATNADINALIGSSLETVRNRAIHEITNNGYAAGIAGTFATFVVGSGPRLQVNSDDTEFAEFVEAEFPAWAEQADIEGKLSLADMLDLGVRQLCSCGEILATEQSEPDDPRVQLRYRFLEPHRLADPWSLIGSEQVHNGIEVNDAGKPTTYYIHKAHPGTSKNWSKVGEYDKVPADQVVHVYRYDRAEADRGFPWLMPSIDVFAKLRRWTLAVIDAAETAANLALFMTTSSETVTAEEVESADLFEVERNMMMTLPAHWKPEQLDAKYPPSSYKEVKAELIGEAARPVHMPTNIALANSAGYNYASGRLDHQAYFRYIRLVQNWLSRRLLNRVLARWLDEALRIPGYVPGNRARRIGRPRMRMLTTGRQAERGAVPMARLDFAGQPAQLVARDLIAWYWPGFEHVDPLKEANAQDTKLRNGATNLIDEDAREGRDWEQQMRKRFRVKKRAVQMVEDEGEGKVTVEDLLPHLTPKTAAPAPEAPDKDKDEDDDDDDES